MSIVRWKPGETHFKSATAPVSVERITRRQEKQKRLEDAYKAAETRDQMRCRVTGKRLSKSSVSDAERLEHHHLVKRSRSKTLREDVKNLVCVSALVHRLIEHRWIECEGTNADGALFWHYTKLATVKPVQIRRWNPRGEKEE